MVILPYKNEGAASSNYLFVEAFYILEGNLFPEGSVKFSFLSLINLIEWLWVVPSFLFVLETCEE